MSPLPGRRGVELPDGLNAAFPTPLYLQRFGDDDLAARLRDLILEREAASAGVRMSNVRGWHSEGDLLEWGDPAVTELRTRITKVLMAILEQARNPEWSMDARSRVRAWANVSRDGAYNAIHNHAPALFSGVYYVATGDPVAAGSRDGLIEFVDPRPGPHGGPVPTHAFNRPLVIDPEPGMMLVFPGWLLHFVHPYHGSSPRVSIAFNLSIKSAG